jgi:branched-chain amino acid transport system substrate-binding protein
MFKKGLICLAVLTSLTLLWVGSAFSAGAYVVGCSAAVTGRAAGSYAPVKEALDTYFKAVNDAGGINGHPVKIIFMDNAGQPTKAAADAKKLVTQDNVLLLINTSLSSTYAPMIQVAKRHKTPFFFAGGVCPEQVYPPKPDAGMFCSTAYAAKYDSRFAISFIKGVAKGPVKLHLVAMNIPVSRGEIDFAAQLASKTEGFTVTGKEAIPPPTPDYTPFATKIKNAGANWVYAWAPWVTQVKTLEALRKLGWKGNYLAYSHIPAEQELGRLKDDKLYVFGANAMFVDDTETHKKIKTTAAKYKTIYPYQKLTEGWVAGVVLEQILKATPWPATREKVAKAMSELKADVKDLRGGSIIWTPSNHFRTKAYFRVYKWDSAAGGVKVVKDWVPVDIK